MNRETFIEKLTEVQRTIEQLLAHLQANETDSFVAHLYHARRHYRLVCERPNKGSVLPVQGDCRRFQEKG